MKLKALILSSLAVVLFTACSPDNESDASENNNSTNNNDSAVEENENANEENANEDVVTTASIVSEADAFVSALSEDGNWIVAALNDITVDEELVVAGTFYNKDDESSDVYRKLALYTQDDDRNVLETFTITVPKLTVQSENFTVPQGTIKGDVYVEANGFTLNEDATIDGGLYYANEEAQSTAVIEGTVTGGPDGTDADVLTTASLVYDNEPLVNALSEGGNWIVAIYGDMVFDEELVVSGKFYNKDDDSSEDNVYRKLAMYTQDSDRNVLQRFSLTVPQLTVESENFNIYNGTIVGDVYVEADGFTLAGATVEGNVYFANEDYEASANLDDGTVTGDVEVQ